MRPAPMIPRFAVLLASAVLLVGATNPPPHPPPAGASPASPPPAPPPAPGTTGGEAPSGPLVRLEGDRLTVRVVDVPLDDVLRRITSESGARLQGTLRNARSVSIDLDAVPLEEGMSRLLGDQNFMLAYRADGSLSRLTLVGGNAAVPATRVVPAVAEAEHEPEHQPGGLLQHNVALLPGGHLQKLLGRKRATLQELLDIALRNPDAEVRVEAMHAGIKGIDQDPELTQLTKTMLSNLDDAQLEAAIRSVAGDGAYDLVSQFSTAANNVELRMRGLRLMQRMAPQR